MSKRIAMVGGPLDGQVVSNNGYFEEGDIEAVDTLRYREINPRWSAESVYRVQGGELVYDPEATKRRRLIVDIGGTPT